MVFSSYWDDGLYLPEDTGNWIEAVYGRSSDDSFVGWQYTKIKFVGLVFQETT